MTREQWARAWFGLTARAAAVGLLLQLIAAVGNDEGVFPTAAGRIFNVFCYFTIQSNVIVGVTCLLLALRLDRFSTAFAVFRLIGVLAIAVTGVVFHVALSQIRELNGHEAVADALLHTVVPIAAVLGWLAFGPRGLVSMRIVLLALAFPVCWIVFTLVRGPIVDFYPYPFIDVTDHGYPRVLLNCAVIAVLFFALAAGAMLLDRRLRWGRSVAA